jgi:hypothetical protein
VMNLQFSILMAQTNGTPHCIAHGGGRRCQHAGCSKAVAKAAGSMYCRLCHQGVQPDDAQEGAARVAQAPQATDEDTRTPRDLHENMLALHQRRQRDRAAQAPRGTWRTLSLEASKRK